MTTNSNTKPEATENSTDQLPVSAQPKKRSSPLPSLAWIGITIGAFIIGGSGGIVLGTHFAKAASQATALGAPGVSGAFGPGGQGSFRAMRGIRGTVTAISSGSITLKDDFQNTNHTYKITSSTTVTKDGSAAGVSDIKTGATVMVQVSSSDSATAASIRIDSGSTTGTSSGNTNNT
jgi:hypothetical protein